MLQGFGKKMAYKCKRSCVTNFKVLCVLIANVLDGTRYCEWGSRSGILECHVANSIKH